MKKHANIPVFVPHVGCPNDCVFCNQRTISGKMEFDPQSVVEEIEKGLETLSGALPQIAFFGGSFTGIERSLMITLLEMATRFVKEGRAHSIRLSTRPDYIDGEIIKILKAYPVKNVELGIQSTDDEVLRLNRRGHSAQQSKTAMLSLYDEGFEVTGQMMTGMLGGSLESEIKTAEDIADAHATSARIYPTVVFSSTALGDLYKKGLYTPPTIEESVERGASVLEVFEKRGVDVIRIGLQSSEGLHSAEVIAGEYHDAIGEMIIARKNLRKMRERLKNMSFEKGDTVTLTVPKNLLSQYIGQKRENVLTLEREFGIKLKIEN